MKSFVIAFGTLVAAVAAQNPSNLSPCGQNCLDSMLSAEKAQELNCPVNELKCLCANPNFLYGLRDCSAASCGSEGDKQQLVEHGIGLCKSAGVAITTTGGDSENPGSTASSSGATPTSVGGGNGGHSGSESVSTIFSTVTSDGSTITTAVATSAQGSGSDSGSGHVSTPTSVAGGASQPSSFTTIVTGEDGKPSTSVGSVSDIGSSTGAGGATETASAVLTTLTSDGSEIIKTLTTIQKTGEDSATATEGSQTAGKTGSQATKTGSASSSSSMGGASMPQKTAAPVGVLAVAGLALLMF